MFILFVISIGTYGLLFYRNLVSYNNNRYGSISIYGAVIKSIQKRPVWGYTSLTTRKSGYTLRKK